MFIFYFLGVGLPCCSIFCQFWLCEEVQCVYLRHHLGSSTIDQEAILKAAREKETVTYKGVPVYQLISQRKPCSQEGAGKKYLKS